MKTEAEIVNLIKRDATECWYELIRNPKKIEDFQLNHALYHRIDALVLVASKILGMSFMATCESFGIPYGLLQDFGDDKNAQKQ